MNSQFETILSGQPQCVRDVVDMVRADPIYAKLMPTRGMFGISIEGRVCIFGVRVSLKGSEAKTIGELFEACHYSMDWSPKVYQIITSVGDAIVLSGEYSKICCCYPTIAVIMPELTEYFNTIGVSIKYDGCNFEMWFTHAPGVRSAIEVGNDPRKIADCRGDLLYRQLYSKYLTPYFEEVAALELLKSLPSPIAEAIADCIWAVIARRPKRGNHRATFNNSVPPWESETAWLREVEYTYFDMYGEETLVEPYYEPGQSWEDAVAALHDNEPPWDMD
jgi:hypothetical protein